MWDDEGTPFDARIDDVARRMTDVAPPADLRARLLARIAAGEGRRAPHAMTWALSSAATAAAIVVGVLLGGGRPHAPQPSRFIGSAPAVVPKADNALMRAAASAPAAAGTARQRRLPRTVSGGERSSDFEPAADFQLAPLAVGWMQLSPIDAPDRTRPEAVGIAPLSVTPLSAEGEK